LDDAFHFYYEDNLARLRQLGAELAYFSPLKDTHLPAVDGVYLGGGYPELHAERLSDNQHLRRDLVQFAREGGPVYGECGGLMYLCQAIQTQGGKLHPMLGLLPGTAVVQSRLQALGYVEVETRADSVFGGAGLRFRGHQFRYSELRGVADDAARLYRVTRCRSGEVSAEGYSSGSVLGSYVHAHWASNPRLAAGFVGACSAHAERKAKFDPRWAG
jgi:cobyrinic acid a,c-diamide synthase